MSATSCTHHNDQQRIACPVCVVTKLNFELEHWREIATTSTAEREHNANAAAEITVHRDQLRARAERAEAELATERARLDWVFHNCKVIANDTTGNGYIYAVNDREDLGAAMKVRGTVK